MPRATFTLPRITALPSPFTIVPSRPKLPPMTPGEVDLLDRLPWRVSEPLPTIMRSVGLVGVTSTVSMYSATAVTILVGLTQDQSEASSSAGAVASAPALA